MLCMYGDHVYLSSDQSEPGRTIAKLTTRKGTRKQRALTVQLHKERKGLKKQEITFHFCHCVILGSVLAPSTYGQNES